MPTSLIENIHNYYYYLFDSYRQAVSQESVNIHSESNQRAIRKKQSYISVNIRYYNGTNVYYNFFMGNTKSDCRVPCKTTRVRNVNNGKKTIQILK